MVNVGGSQFHANHKNPYLYGKISHTGVVAEAQAAPTLSKLAAIYHKSLYKHSLYLTPMSLPVVISLFQCNILWRVG